MFSHPSPQTQLCTTCVLDPGDGVRNNYTVLTGLSSQSNGGHQCTIIILIEGSKFGGIRDTALIREGVEGWVKCFLSEEAGMSVKRIPTEEAKGWGSIVICIGSNIQPNIIDSQSLCGNY